jgi:hypothetical protein
MMTLSGVMTPIVMLTLFNYFSGGALSAGLDGVAHGTPYIDCLAPAIIIMTAGSGCAATCAVSLVGTSRESATSMTASSFRDARAGFVFFSITARISPLHGFLLRSVISLNRAVICWKMVAWQLAATQRNQARFSPPSSARQAPDTVMRWSTYSVTGG